MALSIRPEYHAAIQGDGNPDWFKSRRTIPSPSSEGDGPDWDTRPVQNVNRRSEFRVIRTSYGEHVRNCSILESEA
ncbi:MAG TPA: hypothetical protein EYN66_23330 [Myxococcales bacterium]|nr:hypothetical protein [Myxococcales bacterium]